ncbi:Protein COFACTOR ASSEMBLY OF COMPLEX C SUBUNIT B CCB2, chloroplastic [Glycine max]|uniref:protein COFACTOR ASSEMBLY OF COMPLEX C SUBUNIT B CCB2, chloroplastic-like n=1 Tax=Glycine soja TaxID=3848 RepID=UPI001038BDAF|nr:protein COFACTOR ASSEMBLY OF COMPLEX C SUBUNIT B CCB2, chloroplastic-like [Glycine soja]KAH1233718.1 Protein COFACTOR ASSEMBLY OF COMPLEX C SUBUNIT B CCB2, chloroplastic [Glycine max]
MNVVRFKYGISISLVVAWKAKMIAKVIVDEDAIKQYCYLEAYGEERMHICVGNNYKLILERPPGLLLPEERILGLDESYLPRWIGYGFGSLLLLNHFLGSDSATVTPAQLSTKVLGLSLVSFSIVLPYLGKFLKGAQPMDEKTIPDDTEQIFVMSTDIVDCLKEDLAWASYVLLRNTNVIAMVTCKYHYKL